MNFDSFGAVIGAAIGNEVGQSKALEYQWQCHMLLTALQVEENTNHIKGNTCDAADLMYAEAYPGSRDIDPETRREP